MGQASELAALAGADTPGVAWQCLRIGTRLGKGVIYQAMQDGSEMASCVSTGAHPSVIPILGTFAGHLQGAMGWSCR